MTMPSNFYSKAALNIEISDVLNQWMRCQTPITLKLQELTGEAQLEILSQEWVRPNWWDVHFLKLKTQKIYQREIFMRSHGSVYWYARTVIPEQCYQLDPAFFKRLERESIRYLIFNEPRVQRINQMVYPVNRECMEFYWIKKHLKNIAGIFWVRLVEYSFHTTESFYLIEILFPELENIQ